MTTTNTDNADGQPMGSTKTMVPERKEQTGADAESRHARVPVRREEDSVDVLAEHSEVLQDGAGVPAGPGGQEWQERESRNALKHVLGLGEKKDVTEVEYRQVRLERVVLVGVWSSAQTTQTRAEESLRELAALAETAGAEVMDGLLQHRLRPDSATYVGSGKAKEIARIVEQLDADTIVVDADLPPSQRRGLEDVAKVKVVDRTAVILDIFAQHATSREGKAQVELAQLEYMLPRLRGWGGSLSRQAGGQAAGQNGGIGSRGPGETQIEMDRRVIRSRMARLRRQIAQMAPAREVKRGSRRRHGMPSVAVVGYTNAGKSSLTNRLTGSEELVGNALFATLDTAVRRTKSANGRIYTYVDTVGFVRRLPTQLVEAFKSTLEEVGEADVILHVVDASHPDPFAQIDAVNDVLSDIDGVEGIPRILAFNKIDMIDGTTRDRLAELDRDAFLVSAANGDGVDELRTAIERLLPVPDVHVSALLPYDAGSLVSAVREYGIVTSVDYRGDGIYVEADVDDHLAARIVERSIDDGVDGEERIGSSV
ncbi:GTP-binding protein [Bifidobacterium margollesii]|uniref:GTPase HflX n=2 Tax=Bifidobacterium margollesii TaxID=2020964 RepID=A0A2N5JBK4_9BIFI|nr:GTPase HflX [Bifidobacterium margollesii]PLS31589.1 GTP-binding protein [Bifidobacterium margollesii]